VSEIDIGMGKTGRRAYSLDEVAILPSRRTRDADEVDVAWQLDAFHFDIPVIGAALDGVTSPATAVELDRLGGVGALHLEGLWTRYEDPTDALARAAALQPGDRARELREIYAPPVRPELIARRIAEIREGGATACVARRTPSRCSPTSSPRNPTSWSSRAPSPRRSTSAPGTPNRSTSSSSCAAWTSP
jgi:IMP dehydrogenase